MSVTKKLFGELWGKLAQLQRVMQGKEEDAPALLPKEDEPRTMEDVQRDYALACNQYGHDSLQLAQLQRRVDGSMTRMAMLTEEGQRVAASLAQAENKRPANPLKSVPDEREQADETAEQMTP